MCLQDTLPRAYEFELFRDYLKPYLLRNGHRKFQATRIPKKKTLIKHSGFWFSLETPQALVTLALLVFIFRLLGVWHLPSTAQNPTLPDQMVSRFRALKYENCVCSVPNLGVHQCCLCCPGQS